MILFESKEIEEQFNNLPGVLKYIFDFFVLISLQEKVVPKVLRILNHKYEVSHMNGRAVDVMNEMGIGGMHLFNPNAVDRILERMRERFPGLIIVSTNSQNWREKFGRRAAQHFHIEIPSEWHFDSENKIREFQSHEA